MLITEFLEARIAEDERHARKLAETDNRPILSLATTINHPARLIAECAAKRAILALYRPSDLDSNDRGAYFYAEGAGDAVKALAAVYADHPDYQPEWKP